MTSFLLAQKKHTLRLGMYRGRPGRVFLNGGRGPLEAAGDDGADVVVSLVTFQILR
jgi:hypothetical protein